MQQNRRVRQRRRRRSGLAAATAVVLVCHHAMTLVVVFAWIPSTTNMSTRPAIVLKPSSNKIRRYGHLESRLFASNKENKDNNSDDNDDDGLLSDLDARVLQSMLQDSANKLDLQQEENMKKLLERGIKSKQKVESPVKQPEPVSSDYSSQVIKTLADTKLWKALSRNAQDFVESAKIAIANRVERDAKLIASLGIFALDRALQDVSRALPAAASFTQNKKIFQLSDKSSFEPQIDAASSDKRVDLRKEFSTPQDEFKSVSAEIKQIFEQADQKVTPRSLSSAQRSLPSSASSLKSTARRGTARLSSAYQRQQKTKLAREKENLAQKAPRLASNVIDSAYQVKRELQIEPNQPGYKTKRLREATASTAKLLASAAKAGASSLLLGQGEKKKGSNQLPAASTSATSSTAPLDVDVVPPSTNGVSTSSQRDTAMDATARAMDAAFFASKTVDKTNSINNNKVKADPVDFLDNEPYFAFKREATAPIFNEETRTPSQILQDPDQPTFRTAAYADVEQSPTKPDFTVKATTAEPEVITAEVFASTDGIIEGIDPATIDAFEVVVDRDENSSPADYLYTGYGYAEDATALDDDDLENLRQVTAEVISEEDFESVFGQAKEVDNLGDFDDDEDDEEKPPNLLVSLTLRSLDVVFLVVEKTVLLIPDILALTSRVAARVGEVNREGMGQIGWQPLNTKIRGSKRY
jgi:hypothetical protein